MLSTISFFNSSILGYFIGGVITTVIASIVYIIFFQILKPKIKFSDSIAKRGEPDSKSKCKYAIKVINTSKFFTLYEINARLHLVRVDTNNHGSKNGEMLYTTKIELINSNPFLLKRLNKKDTAYAYRFGTSEDIEEKIKKKNYDYILFRMTGRHQFSSRIWYYEKKYYSPQLTSWFKDGVFKHGNTTEIVNNQSIDTED